MARNSVKTIYSTKLELLRSKGLPFTVSDFSTINQKFNIGNITPPTVGYPTIDYLAIGRGGHRIATGVGNASIIDILEHGPTDAALFEHIPFVLRLVTNDLTPAERSNYRVRKLETHNGEQYFAYYLRKLNSVSTAPDTSVVTLEDGAIISDVPYVPASNNLTPSPVALSNTNVNTVSGRHIVVKTLEVVTLSEPDINEIRDAIFIIYGDYRYATISELALISGFDIPVTTTDGGVNATYDEIQSGQCVNFIGTEYSLHDARTEIQFTYSLSSLNAYPPTAI